MARARNSIIGEITGSIGDVTIRQRKGRTIISARPKRFMPGDDENSVKRRATFGIATRLAKEIHSIPELSTIWTRNLPEGKKSGYNFIITSNLKQVGPNSMTDQAAITPAGGFNVGISGIEFVSDAITAVVGPIGSDSGIDTSSDLFAKLVVVAGIFSTVPEGRPEFAAMSSGKQKLALDAALRFALPFGGIDPKKSGPANEIHLMLAVVLLDKDEKPTKFSKTVHIR